MGVGINPPPPLLLHHRHQLAANMTTKKAGTGFITSMPLSSVLGLWSQALGLLALLDRLSPPMYPALVLLGRLFLHPSQRRLGPQDHPQEVLVSTEHTNICYRLPNAVGLVKEDDPQEVCTEVQGDELFNHVRIFRFDISPTNITHLNQ
jgi:hypothetical protein